MIRILELIRILEMIRLTLYQG